MECHLAPGEGCRGQLASWSVSYASWALSRASCQLAPRPELLRLGPILLRGLRSYSSSSFHQRSPNTRTGHWGLVGHPTYSLLGNGWAKKLAVPSLYTCADNMADASPVWLSKCEMQLVKIGMCCECKAQWIYNLV